MNRILISTGALLGRPNGRDYRLLEKLTPQLRCDGYELMIYEDWYNDPEALCALLETAGLTIPSVHCQKDIGKDLAYGEEELTAQALSHFALNCRFASAAKAEKLVIHLWSGRISDQHIENNLNAYPALLQIAQDHGLDLTIENVVCGRQDPFTHLCSLRRRYPDVHFTFDTKNAAFHSQLEGLYAPENAWLKEHIRHYHVNDYAGGHMEWDKLLGRVLPVGKGHIDFDAFFDFVKTSGYDGDFTLESTALGDDGIVDVHMLNEQVLSVKKLLGQ